VQRHVTIDLILCGIKIKNLHLTYTSRSFGPAVFAPIHVIRTFWTHARCLHSLGFHIYQAYRPITSLTEQFHHCACTEGTCNHVTCCSEMT